MSSLPSSGSQGQQFPEDSASEFNAQSALVRSMISKLATTTIVQVVNVTNSGGVAAAGYVDVQPLVNQLDGAGNAMPHAVIFSIPYGRLMGGTNAVILDPKVGDNGIAVFASRDISSVLANQAQANPGSRRRFDWADAMYVGVGLLGAVPTNYVRVSDDGVDITSTSEITLTARTITLTAPTITLNASSGITLNTPLVTTTGGITAAGVVAAAEVDAPIVSVSTTLTVVGKNLGPNHTHSHGTMTSSGITGTVN